MLDTHRNQLRFFLDKEVELGDAFASHPLPSSPSATFYSAVTLKYKGTQVCARFAPPFVHQHALEKYMATFYSTNPSGFLPVVATHPKIRVLECKIATEAVRVNKQESMFYQQPDEALLHIFAFLEPLELARAMRTCRLFRCIASESKLWSRHLNNDFGRDTAALTVDSTARAASPVVEAEPLSEYIASDSSLYSRYRVLHNWANGKLASKRNFWCSAHVHSVAFDNRFIACGASEEIVLFEAATGAKMEPTLQMLEDVLQIDFDQRKLVASGSGGSVYIYDLETSQLTSRLQAHRKDIEAMHLIRDSSSLLTGSWQKDLKLWDLETEDTTFKVENAHTGAISVVRWLDPKVPHVFASASYEPTIKFWDVRVGAAPIHSIAKLHVGAVSALQIAADQSQMVSGGEDATLKLVELRRLSDADKNTTGVSEDGMWLQQYRGHTQTIKGIFFEKSGRLVSGSTDCSVRIWNQTSAKVSSIIPTGKVSSLQCDDDVLLVGLEGKRATMFDFRMFKSENSEARRKFFSSRPRPTSL